MRYHALAADYDGTLAHHGRIDDDTWSALRRLRESGRKLIMVTGRQLEELLGLLDHPELFDRIVAENGALVYEPATKEIRSSCEPPPPEFVDELRRRGVDRIAVGHAIVATWEPHQDTVLHVIHDLGLELQVIFNKGAVMVLPSGVNKATGLAQALFELGLSRHNVVGVGDAENDHALLTCCEAGVAVANALPSLKAHADVVTTADHGAGVSELIEHLLADDLAIAAPKLTRHHVLLGKDGDRALSIDPYATNMMVCGTSGSGKSTLTTGVLERLSQRNYQFAIIDPEGDYANVELAVVLGSPTRAPLASEVLDVLKDPSRNVVVNLLGIAVEHRPEFFAELLPVLAELRTRTGRPHWLVVDEAHHLLPASWEPAAEMALRPHGTLYVTVHPTSVAPAIIKTLDTLVAVGEQPTDSVYELSQLAEVPCPRLAAIPNGGKLGTGQALYWNIANTETTILQTEPPKMERKRHKRKYMEGNLGKTRSFYFRGPDAKLNLKAHNLQLFVHLADGVDDETWIYHLRNHDYSKWLRVEVKDDELADEVALIEQREGTRAEVREAIERRYTLPADKPSGLVDEEDEFVKPSASEPELAAAR
ncbi:MAG TPA: HAD-IIB family hydrolase [Kofleriaceae bacterium]|nr:HAD-IIB family hydrolase [Kofleriaceae bacterium]